MVQHVCVCHFHLTSSSVKSKRYGKFVKGFSVATLETTKNIRMLNSHQVLKCSIWFAIITNFWCTIIWCWKIKQFGYALWVNFWWRQAIFKLGSTLQRYTSDVTCLVPRPDIFRLGQAFSSHVVRSEKCGLTQIRHRNKLTVNARKKVVHKLGNNRLFSLSRYEKK